MFLKCLHFTLYYNSKFRLRQYLILGESSIRPTYTVPPCTSTNTWYKNILVICLSGPKLEGCYYWSQRILNSESFGKLVKLKIKNAALQDLLKAKESHSKMSNLKYGKLKLQLELQPYLRSKQLTNPKPTIVDFTFNLGH